MIKPGDIHRKKILFGCLNWGSGHVSRSIPLISQLTEQTNEVTIWCSKSQEEIFRQFNLRVSYHSGFHSDFKFKGDGNFFLEMLRNSFSFLRKLKQERKDVERFLSKNYIDLIISDHRYGLFSSKVEAVFLTHQLNLPEKSGFIAQKIHERLMKKFSFIWIMDDENDSLGGKLSKKAVNGNYIGHFSRFSLTDLPAVKTLKYVAVISGPKEYAKQFYDGIKVFAEKDPENWAIICPESISDKSSSVIHFHNWISGDKAISSAETIISRCGYSTLMDLKFLGTKAILIPTPGQLEQEYLKSYLSGKNPDWMFPDNLSVL